jgi:hypothetical protein
LASRSTITQRESFSRLSPRQCHDKIPDNLFPLGYLQRLQQSSRSSTIGHVSLTDVTKKGNILGNFSLHSIAPIGCLEVFVHLIPSWMIGISGIVSLLKYLILQFLDVRHTCNSFVPQYSFIISLNSGDFFFLIMCFISWIFSSSS